MSASVTLCRLSTAHSSFNCHHTGAGCSSQSFRVLYSILFPSSSRKTALLPSYSLYRPLTQKTFARYWDFSLPSAEVRPTNISKVCTVSLVLSKEANACIGEYGASAPPYGGNHDQSSDTNGCVLGLARVAVSLHTFELGLFLNVTQTDRRSYDHLERFLLCILQGCGTTSF
jgi:hypothetical protein